MQKTETKPERIGDYKTKDFDFDARGCFFAFGDKQFDEQKKEGVEYESTSIGLICPKGTAGKVLKELSEFNKKEEEKRIEHFGLERIIAYELGNYECYYTGEWQQVFEMYKDYGATSEMVREIYLKHSY